MIVIDNKNPLWESFVDDLKAVLRNVDVPVAGWPANKLLGTDENGNVVTKEPSFNTESVPGGDTLFPVETSNLFVTPQMFGAVGDGVADDTQAIQAMFDDVAGVGKVYFPHGNYLTTVPIVVEQVPDIEMDGMIMSNHAGVALDLGTDTFTIIDKTIKLKVKKKSTKYEAGSVGLLLHSAARNTFYLDTVNNFETNVRLLSTGGKGIWFNTFHLNNLNSAKYGLYLDGSNDGWINDNLFIGGSISVDSDSTGITIDHGGSNVFLKQGLEGAGTCVHIIYGGTNSFLQSRCEKAIYGLVVDEGNNNIMQSNYALPEFVNNSRYTTNGIIQPGIHGVCQHPSVSVDRLEDDKFLKCDDRVVPTYCQMIHATSGTVSEDLPSNSFFFENGVWDAVNYRPVFVFDTTKNKKFEFGGNKTPVCINLYSANGKIVLADEDIPQYVKADQITAPRWNINFGGGVYLNASYGFEVSEEVIRIELVYLDSGSGIGGIANFDIRTEYPCYPIRDKILTVPAIPSNGYLGAEIIYNGDLYIYNCTEWKRDDYALTEEDKTEIAEQAVSLIDTALLSVLGSGVLE